MRPPDNWRNARVTLAIATITLAAWVIVAGLGLDSWAQLWGGFIPQRVMGVAGDESLAPVFLTPLTATLVHANLVHIAFNLLMLLFCGRAVEAVLGMRGVIILYVVSAYVAAAAMTPFYWDKPMLGIGASGAISGIFGAYALLFSRNRVNVANSTLARLLHILWMGAAYVILQFMTGFAVSGTVQAGAALAHIGGFVAGLALAMPLLLLRYRSA